MSFITVVIGVGNPDRGDDGAGRAVARRIREAGVPNVHVVELDGEATSLVAQLENADAAYLIDACRSGAAPGTVRRFDAQAGPLPAELGGVSSHGFGVAAGVELARALGLLPPRCIVYAIEGARFEPGAAMSAEIQTAVAALSDALLAELSA